MAKNRLVGDYPVIGIRPTIDGRRGVLGVRESLEAHKGNRIFDDRLDEKKVVLPIANLEKL